MPRATQQSCFVGNRVGEDSTAASATFHGPASATANREAMTWQEERQRPTFNSLGWGVRSSEEVTDTHITRRYRSRGYQFPKPRNFRAWVEEDSVNTRLAGMMNRVSSVRSVDHTAAALHDTGHQMMRTGPT